MALILPMYIWLTILSEEIYLISATAIALTCSLGLSNLILRYSNECFQAKRCSKLSTPEQPVHGHHTLSKCAQRHRLPLQMNPSLAVLPGILNDDLMLQL